MFVLSVRYLENRVQLILSLPKSSWISLATYIWYRVNHTNAVTWQPKWATPTISISAVGLLKCSPQRMQLHWLTGHYTCIYHILDFFKRTPHTKQEKIVRKTAHSRVTQTPIVQFWVNSVMVVTLMCTRGHAPQRSACTWAWNIAKYGFSVQTYGENLQRAVTRRE